jgi:RpiB/LacA/LacB family sugar-phosphate isomerase
VNAPIRVAVACDHAGFPLKAAVVDWLGAQPQFEPLDLGPSAPERVDYADFAAKVGRAIQDGKARFGVLVCGSGIGISMAANKMRGVRAALICDVTSARLSRAHNDANVICFGARVIGPSVAHDALEVFLQTAFEGGRHVNRVAKIHMLEEG